MKILFLFIPFLLFGQIEAPPSGPQGAAKVVTMTGVPTLICSGASDVGKIRVRSDAAGRGNSYYLCANVASGSYAWELVGALGGPLASDGCGVVKVSSTAVSVFSSATVSTPCTFNSGGIKTYAIIAPITVSTTSGTDTVYFGFNIRTGILWVHAGTASTSCSGSCSTDNGTSLANYEVGIASWSIVSGAWGVKLSELRGQQSATVVTTGAGLNASYNSSTGETTIATTSQAYWIPRTSATAALTAMSGANKTKMSWVHKDLPSTFSQFCYRVTTLDAANTYELGILDLSGNVLFRSGALNTTGTGTVCQNVSGGGTQTLNPGEYIVAWSGSATTAVLAGYNCNTNLTVTESATAATAGLITNPSTVPALAWEMNGSCIDVVLK